MLLIVLPMLFMRAHLFDGPISLTLVPRLLPCWVRWFVSEFRHVCIFPWWFEKLPSLPFRSLPSPPLPSPSLPSVSRFFGVLLSRSLSLSLSLSHMHIYIHMCIRARQYTYRYYRYSHIHIHMPSASNMLVDDVFKESRCLLMNSSLASWGSHCFLFFISWG